MQNSAFKKIITALVAVCLLAVAAFSGWQVYLILHASSTAKSAYSEIAQKAAPEQQPKEENTPVDPLQRAFDWKTLQSDYPGIVAWLSDPNGDLDYPIMQAKDNDYYLNHLPDGTVNNHGSLFLDYEGSAAFADWNNIVYGHNMKDGTMLASLLNYQKQEYYEQHQSLILYTPSGNFTLPVLSGYVTTAVSDAYQQGGTEQDHAAWLKKIRERSAFTAASGSTAEPKVLTLSTCINGTDNSDKRFVLHLGLIAAP